MAKSKSLFDQVFGRTFESIDLGEGISPIKIDSTSIIHFPGVIKYWQQEIEDRKKEAIEFKYRGFLERVVDWIADDEEFDEASGDELYDISPTGVAAEMMEKLEEDPTDMNRRLELVSLVSRSKKDLSIEMVRDLFLQATVACSFGELSNTGLKILLNIQALYLQKLLNQCQIDQAKLKKLLAELLPGKSISRQRKEIKSYVRKVSRNTALIQFYLAYNAQGLESLDTSYPLQLTMDELEALIEAGKEASVSKVKRCFTKANMLVSTLRYLVLMHKEADKYVKLLLTLDPRHPVPSIIKARTHRTRLVFLIQQHKVGDRDSQLGTRIREWFELILLYYHEAMSIVGDDPQDSLAVIIGVEYAEMLHDTTQYLMAAPISELPVAKMKKPLYRADAILLKFIDDIKAKTLLKDIRSLIDRLDGSE